MAADSLPDSPADFSPDAAASPASASPPEGMPPALGERSRQYLRDRQEGRLRPEPPATPIYRVPRLRQDENPPIVSVPNAVVGLHFVAGLLWAVVGMLATWLALRGAPGSTQATAAFFVALTVYGFFCIYLGFSLAVTMRWAWPAAVVEGALWCALLAVGGLLGGGLLLWALLPLAGFNLWALWTRKAAFVDPA